MTASVLLDMPTRRRAFPQIFNRLVVILAVQAHLYALVVIAGSGASYRSLPACLALWAVSLAVPMTCLVLARRTRGALPTVPFLVASVLLVAVDLGLTAVVRLPDRGTGAMWNWGVIGVTILGFAAFRPARDVLVVAGAHGLVAVGVTATTPGQAAAVAFAVLVAANAAVTPALAAARYLDLYIRAVGLREQAAADRRRIQTRHAVERAIEEDAAWRLRSLQAEAVPLLAGVANETLATDDPQVARLARRLGADLRRELMAARSSQWLLPASPAGAGPGPSVELLDPHRLLGRLADSDRLALAALLSVLRGAADWQRLSVALAEAGESAAVTVVATGPAAATAAQDAAVAAAADRFGARLGREASDVLVAETNLMPGPPVDPAERDEG
ncbi:MAG TPA: hypothetical protein VFW50_14495 [Streptosporangiaceae bacterium]|nr:hypothetical protein [Streptosporangiaceae bacterium]